jgi:hypothetical protein
VIWEVEMINLPPEWEIICNAAQALEDQYRRKFTPDGHLVGSLGEVIAQKEFDLELLSMSNKGPDAKDKYGNFVQIKLGGIKSSGFDMSKPAEKERLIVMRIKDKKMAELVYDGDANFAWNKGGKIRVKHGGEERTVSFKKLQSL